MTTGTRYDFRAKNDDEKALLTLSQYLERNISDTVRFAIRHTARDYGLLPKKKSPVVRKKKQVIET